MYVGLHIHAGPASWVAEKLPCNIHRLWDVDAPISWDAIDQPGGYQWGYLDWRVAVAQEAGCQVSYVIGITPQRLRTSTVSDGHNIPGGSSFPSDTAPFRAFVRALVERYPASVMPILELPELVPPYFNRSAAYLAVLVQIMREEAPDRLIPTPAFYSIDQLAEYLAQPLAKPCDALNLHLYGQDADMLRVTLAAYDEVARDAGVKAPVWLSEFGWRLDQQKAPDWPIASMSADQIAASVVAGTFDVLRERGDLGGAWYSFDSNRPDVLYSMADKPQLIAAMSAALGGDMPAPPKPNYPAKPASPTSEQLNNWLRECEEITRQWNAAIAVWQGENYLAVNAADVTARQQQTTATEASATAQTTLARSNQALADASKSGAEAMTLSNLAATYIQNGKSPDEAAALAKLVYAQLKPRPIFTF